MNAQTLTVISGAVLLLVFVLAGLRIKRRRPSTSGAGRDERPHPQA